MVGAASPQDVFDEPWTRRVRRRRIMPSLLAMFVLFLAGATSIAQHETRDSTSRVGQPSVRDTTAPSLTSTPSINGWKLAAVSAAAVSTLGASYLYLKETWWKDGTTAFHFDDGPDLRYARNLDKAAHFYGGLIGSDLFYGALRWTGMSKTTSLYTGAAFGTFVQFAIEFKDGFSPRWGWSWQDVAWGTVGSWYPLARHYWPFLKNVDFKWSYWRRSDRYFQVKQTGTWNDDYVNQTYWMSVKVNNLLPESVEPYWPDFLAVALGVGIDDDYDGLGGGNIEIYLSLDYDLPRIFPSSSPLWEAVKHYLNYIHFPAPAVRLTPTAIWYGFYF